MGWVKHESPDPGPRVSSLLSSQVVFKGAPNPDWIFWGHEQVWWGHCLPFTRLSSCSSCTVSSNTQIIGLTLGLICRGVVEGRRFLETPPFDRSAIMAWELYAKQFQWDVARYITTKCCIWEVHRKIQREWGGKNLKTTQYSVLGLGASVRDRGSETCGRAGQVSWQMSWYSVKTSSPPLFTKACGNRTDIRNSSAFQGEIKW